jgi:C4-dicarboxylate transporter DctQ subunit
MKRFLKNIDEKVSAFVLAFILALTFVNVVARYCFTASFSYTEELTTMFLILLSTLGSGIAAKRRAHLGLSALTDLLPKKYQGYVGFMTNGCGTVFSTILLYTGVTMVIGEYSLGQISIGLQVPTWIYCLFVPIGALAMLFHFSRMALLSLRGNGNDHKGHLSIRSPLER